MEWSVGEVSLRRRKKAFKMLFSLHWSGHEIVLSDVIKKIINGRHCKCCIWKVCKNKIKIFISRLTFLLSTLLSCQNYNEATQSSSKMFTLQFLNWTSEVFKCLHFSLQTTLKSSIKSFVSLLFCTRRCLKIIPAASHFINYSSISFNFKQSSHHTRTAPQPIYMAI